MAPTEKMNETVPKDNPYIWHGGDYDEIFLEYELDEGKVFGDIIKLLERDPEVNDDARTFQGRRVYSLIQDLMHDYRNSVVRNGDEVWFRGTLVEIMGMFHRDDDDNKMYLGVLIVDSGVQQLIDIKE